MKNEVNLENHSPEQGQDIEEAQEALNSCPEYLKHLCLRIDTLLALYREEKFEDANIHFGEMVELLNLFIQLMSNIQQFIRSHVDGKEWRSSNMTELETHLSSVLRAMVPAKEKNDIIMLSDLLQYELKDNLIQWDKKVIPKLKKILDDLGE